MISQNLLVARRYEESDDRQVPAEKRPLFHLTPRIGWMNDPNGFSLYKGEYHLFYQYYPFSKVWGPMHWGHAVTKDFLQWEYKPAALAPDIMADRDGCFSGSAIELDDGKHLLMYTGVVRIPQPGKEVFTQTQCIATGDGENYNKYFGNPVLTVAQMPPHSSPFDFRDPKIWKEKDGTFGSVIVNNKDDEHGRVLYYKSKDGFKWEFVSILADNDGTYGKMWECPDFFELDGKYVLLVSPQDMMQTDEYYNGNNTMYMIGSYDSENHKFISEADHVADCGLDFYATQTLLTADGRRIMVGWMQNWDTILYKEETIPWFGQMTLPREITVRGDRLIQKPVREFDEHRTNRIEYSNVKVEEKTELEGIRGRVMDLTLEIQEDPADPFSRFELRFADNGEHYTSLVFRPAEKKLEIDRSRAGGRKALSHYRSCTVANYSGTLKLRMILDRFSSEIFINDGEQTISTVIFTSLDADRINFSAVGKAVMNIEKYDLSF